VGALEEAGDLLIPMREGLIDRSHVVAELAEVVTGRRTGRTGPDDITVFKSVGFALEDLAAAQLAYDRARAEGIGKEVNL
jgi:ornithine cyclodeaminase/alanine dehydrogenase